MTLQSDLQAVTRELQKLTSKLAKIVKRVGKLEKPKTMPVKRQRARVNSTQTVLAIIRESKDGINAKTLIKKSGYPDKKIRNILFQALKHGRIKRVRRGSYAIADR
jgi:hypothetical protein